MTAPFIRTWIRTRLDERRNNASHAWQALRTRLPVRHHRSRRSGFDPAVLPDLVDRAFYAFHRRCNAVWDDWIRVHGDLRGVPAADTDTGAALGTAPPALTLTLILPCRTCGARANAPCTNRWGETTGPHKARRDDAAAAADLSEVTS